MRVEPELPNHPKFVRLKRRVGDYAMEALIRIWGHCQQNGRGEHWRGADAEYLELIADWEGEPGLLFRSLTDPTINFVQVVEGGLLIHDWNETNKQIVKNWENGPRGGRPANPNKHVLKNPVVNQLVTVGVTSGETQTGNGFSAISGETPGNPMVNPNPNSVNQLETHCKPTQRNVTKPNETKPEGMQGGKRYDQAQELIEFLNAETGAQFRGTPLELELVASCLARSGGDVEGVKKMITRQKALWTDEPRLRSCLQPRTLFDPEKFDSYYAQRELPVTSTDTTTRRQELEGLILRSPANRSSVFHRGDHTTTDKENLKKWRQELASLDQKAAA